MRSHRRARGASMVLLTKSVSGQRRRGCDTTCHRAKGTKCTCVCRGRYHGVERLAREQGLWPATQIAQVYTLTHLAAQVRAAAAHRR